MGKFSLMQLSNEEMNTDEVAHKNDLPKSCHYHKFMFKLSKKTIQGKKHHNIVKIAKNRSWNKVVNQLAANISWDHS